MKLGTRLDARLSFLTAEHHKGTLSSVLVYPSSGLVDWGASITEYLFLFIFIFIVFREREKEKERERNIGVTEKY